MAGARGQQPASVFPLLPRSSLFPSGKLSARHLFAGRCWLLSLHSSEAVRESWLGARTSPAWSCYGSSRGPQEGAGALGEAGPPLAPCSAVPLHIRGPQSPCPAARLRSVVHRLWESREPLRQEVRATAPPAPPSLRPHRARGLHHCQVPIFFKRGETPLECKLGTERQKGLCKPALLAPKVACPRWEPQGGQAPHGAWAASGASPLPRALLSQVENGLQAGLGECLQKSETQPPTERTAEPSWAGGLGKTA